MKNLSKNLRLFLDNDDGFIQWCYDNPDGFFWNCFRKHGNVVEAYMLHGAIIRGELCQHFRNGSRASGFVENLTTRSYCKVCSVDRKALETWAQGSPHSLLYCSDCIGLP
jgi:hypothetical protein